MRTLPYVLLSCVISTLVALPGCIVETETDDDEDDLELVDSSEGALTPTRKEITPRMAKMKTLIVDRFGTGKGIDPKKIGCIRADSLKWHPTGVACDFTVSTAIGREPTAAQRKVGEAVYAFVKTNAADYGLNHVIYAGKIYSVGRGERPYSGKGVTLGHYDHVHVAVN